MNTVQLSANPFAMMIDPQAVITAMDRSDRLARLRRQVYHPLDKPLLARRDAKMAAFDELVDADPSDDAAGDDLGDEH